MGGEGRDRAVTGATPWDGAWLSILRASRSGTLATDRPYSVTELAHRLGVSPGDVRGAVFRLEYQGLVRRTGVDTVVLAQPDPVRWGAASRALGGMIEYVVRSSVAVLAEDQVRHYRTLVDDAEQALRLRSDTGRSAVLATLAFWIDVCPNPLLARFSRRSLEAVSYGLDPAITWRTWDADAWLSASLLAATTGDRDIAHEAGHALRRLRDDRAVDVADQLGQSDDALLRPPDLRGVVPSIVPSSTMNSAWDTLLGAVRGGRFPIGQPCTIDEVVALTGRSTAEADVAVRQLEVMGLAEILPGVRTTFRVRRPSFDDWADNAVALLGFAELALLVTVDHLADLDVSPAHAVIARVGRYAAIRDPRLTAALVDLAGWLADVVPDPFVRDALQYAHSRTFLLLDEPPTFRQWGVTDAVAHLERALRGDVHAAAEAAHALARHLDAHVADARSRYGTMEP